MFGSWLTGGGLGFVHVPRDLVLQHDTKNIRANGGIVRYSRDEWGLRGDHKHPSEINILTIGGSTTDELYSDDTETWSAGLQQKFIQVGIPAVVNNSALVRMVRLIRGSYMAKKLRVTYEATPPKLKQYGSSPKFDETPYREALSAYGHRIKRQAERSDRMAAIPIFISQRRGDAILRGEVMYATGGKAVKDFHVHNLYNRNLLNTCRAIKAVCVDLAGRIRLSAVDFF